MNQQIAEETAKILLEIKAVTLNPEKPYTYASGILSPVYTDCRLLMSYPKQRRQIRDFYIELIKEHVPHVELIAGTATAGIPHAAWIADVLDLPMLYARSKPKGHGKGNLLEGVVKPGQKAVVIEDLISRAGSSITTAKAIREAGGTCDYIIAITTYNMAEAEENLKNENLQLVTMTDFNTTVKIAIQEGYIQLDQKDTVLEWAKDTSGWGKKMGFV